MTLYDSKYSKSDPRDVGIIKMKDKVLHISLYTTCAHSSCNIAIITHICIYIYIYFIYSTYMLTVKAAKFLNNYAITTLRDLKINVKSI